ncbi:hypothetical protein CYMTET_52603 [Cymbomonas tetramitiformis]|uniref:DUF885 domain-containing protein n=1 Tax=Cymbomonas tetramitiformis TaxID=36881 RepID=A0AAE0BIP9_9CHLO|nr:hypothetical protein CYMTET_52603 [Cymbomonas tetramitiformis]|eukprot:gene7624-9078_t
MNCRCGVKHAVGCEPWYEVDVLAMSRKRRRLPLAMSSAHTAATQALARITDEIWAWRLVESPQFATCVGAHSTDHLLDDQSLERFRARERSLRGFLTELDRCVPPARVAELLPDPEARLNHRLLRKELADYLRAIKHRPFLLCLSALEGPQTDLPQVLSYMPLRTTEHYDILSRRLEAFPAQATQVADLLREGIKQCRVMPRDVMHGVVDQLRALAEPSAADVDGDPLNKPFAEVPKGVDPDVVARGRAAVAERVRPAFAMLAAFAESVYLPSCRGSIACTALPDGAEWYAECLRFHTDSNMPAQEIHDLGLREVARIKTEMATVARGALRSLDGETGAAEPCEAAEEAAACARYAGHLRSSPEFEAASPAALLTHYRALLARVFPELPKLFGLLPRTPCAVEPTAPHAAAQAPTALYLGPDGTGSRPGVFYLNTSKLPSRRLYEAEALVLHEAVPGHHLQGALAAENHELPEFRRYFDDRRYFECPARFPLNTAYCEGWGLYAESLGEELGLYDTPAGKYGALSMEVWRAMRLVVDTGLHALGWSEERAVDYMLEHSALARANVEAEVRRYITWPGQACAYTVGMLRIRQLRAKAEAKCAAAGVSFDVRRFHDAVLACAAVPLDVLEEIVDEFIQQQSAPPPPPASPPPSSAAAADE